MEPDSVHPSADAPPGCEILSFGMSTPNDAGLRRVCAVLGLDVAVTHGDRPRLVARIAGPGGRIIKLSS